LWYFKGAGQPFVPMGVYDHPPPEDAEAVGAIELDDPGYPILGVDVSRFLRQLNQLTRARDWLSDQLEFPD
jgi:hypothetical protein